MLAEHSISLTQSSKQKHFYCFVYRLNTERNETWVVWRRVQCFCFHSKRVYLLEGKRTAPKEQKHKLAASHVQKFVRFNRSKLLKCLCNAFVNSSSSALNFTRIFLNLLFFRQRNNNIVKKHHKKQLSHGLKASRFSFCLQHRYSVFLKDISKIFLSRVVWSEQIHSLIDWELILN